MTENTLPTPRLACQIITVQATIVACRNVTVWPQMADHLRRSEQQGAKLAAAQSRGWPIVTVETAIEGK